MELLIIDGPTGSGKSALLQHVRETKRQSLCAPKKLTTRQRRDAFDNDHRFVDRISSDNRYLVYEDVGATYAIDLEEVKQFRSQKKIPVIICTNTNAIRRLKKYFEAKTIFVYRHFDEETVSDLMMARGVTNPENIAERLHELSTLTERYSERILLYDHVILNIGKLELLFSQFDRILRAAKKGI